jgi:Beta-galactosidase
MRLFLLRFLCAGSLFLTASLTADETLRPVDRRQDEARGIYALWVPNEAAAERMRALPFVRGGQIVVQWAKLEPEPGRYDFSALDAQLATMAKRGWRATLQVNGNVKPEWLFAQVPYVKEKLHQQVRDPRGTLMFWHPRFQEAHLAMIEALARHLKASPHRGNLLGLRLNFNAIGTEQLRVPAELADPAKWVFPEGVSRAGVLRYSDAVRTEYEEKVVAAYDRHFADWATVFVRNNIDDEVEVRIASKLNAGRLSLFHTSSEVEPRSRSTERQYGLFYEYGRAGRTMAYAEPWASAWGEHGGKTDPRWCSPAQWNYWTLLLNLHCGVSVIGEYFANLNYAATGEHAGDAPVSPASAGPREFAAAYTWAADYIGLHHRPAASPGAWVAFRENFEAKAANENVPAANRKLARFTGDYDWLMHRVAGDGSVGVGPVGPPDQRFGAFARRFPAGAEAKLALDSEFRNTLQAGARVRVIYLDEARTAPAWISVRTRAGVEKIGELNFAGGGRWVAAEFAVSREIAAEFAGDWQFSVSAGADPLILHMIEVLRL